VNIKTPVRVGLTSYVIDADNWIVAKCDGITGEGGRVIQTGEQTAAAIVTALNSLPAIVEALRAANSLRNLGFNEHYASTFPDKVDNSGTSEAEYAAAAEKIEKQIQDALRGIPQ
jgi:hypothetical protein